MLSALPAGISGRQGYGVDGLADLALFFSARKGHARQGAAPRGACFLAAAPRPELVETIAVAGGTAGSDHHRGPEDGRQDQSVFSLGRPSNRLVVVPDWHHQAEQCIYSLLFPALVAP